MTGFKAERVKAVLYLHKAAQQQEYAPYAGKNAGEKRMIGYHQDTERKR